MATIESILQEKGKAVYFVTPENTVLDALKLMADKDIGAVLVMEGEKLLGIFTERDYSRRITLKGNTDATLVKEVMTHPVYFIHPDQSAETCMAQMVDKHFRHLPVVEGQKVIGVVSIYDVVKTVISDKQTLIAGLENFMMGMDLKQ